MVLCVGRTYVRSSGAEVVLAGLVEESPEGERACDLSGAERFVRIRATNKRSINLRILLPRGDAIDRLPRLPVRSSRQTCKDWYSKFPIDNVNGPPSSASTIHMPFQTRPDWHFLNENAAKHERFRVAAPGWTGCG